MNRTGSIRYMCLGCGGNGDNGMCLLNDTITLTSQDHNGVDKK